MNYQRLGLAITDHVARLTLTPATGGNRIDERLLRELQEAATALADRQDVYVLVLDAEGEAFCSGWQEDAREALLQAALAGDPAAVDPFGPLAALPYPTVAALRGRVASAGLELALACDIRIAAEDARFALPEVSEGRLPLAGASQRLPRIAGRATALAMLLLGEELDAQAAYRCGLVSRVFEGGALATEVGALAATIASRGPLGVRYAKEATTRGLEMTLDQGMRFETDLSVILQTTRDREEGLRAFFEKRPPNFEGR